MGCGASSVQHEAQVTHQPQRANQGYVALAKPVGQVQPQQQVPPPQQQQQQQQPVKAEEQNKPQQPPAVPPPPQTNPPPEQTPARNAGPPPPQQTAQQAPQSQQPESLDKEPESQEINKTNLSNTRQDSDTGESIHRLSHNGETTPKYDEDQCNAADGISNIQNQPEKDKQLKNIDVTDQPMSGLDNKDDGKSQVENKNEPADDKTDIEVKSVDINKDTLTRYMELERQIAFSDNRNIVKAMQAKQKEVDDLTETVKQLEEHHRVLVQQTHKEKADVVAMQHPNVRSYFKDQAAFAQQLSKEQEEFLEALNKQEVCKKDLDGVIAQRNRAIAEVNEMNKEGEKVFALYKEQDELLAGIFNGKYGSELEYNLESQLDTLMDRKQRISVARYKWSNARVLMQHACNQLAFACRRWQDLGTPIANTTQKMYIITTEVRNNLVAAVQNISSAQRYLNTITFPYCNPKEVQTLTTATSNIYMDMQSMQRRNHAMMCYTTTHKRSAALIQWMDSVIKNTIEKDLREYSELARKKDQELRAERLQLIKGKIKDVMGADTEFEPQPAETAVPEEPELEKEVPVDNIGVMEADTVSIHEDEPDVPVPVTEEEAPAGGETENQLTTGEAQQEDRTPSPLPLNELAPPPSTEDLFGDIEELKKQHEKQLEDFQKTQELNKARMDAGLQEKLRARKSRRARQAAAEQQYGQVDA